MDRDRRLPDGRSRTTWSPRSNGKVYSAFGFTGSDDVADAVRLRPGLRQLDAAGHGGRHPREAGRRVHRRQDLRHRRLGRQRQPRTRRRRSTTRPPTPGRPGPPTRSRYAGFGHAVLDGKLYVVGGCTATVCGTHRRRGLRPGVEHLVDGRRLPGGDLVGVLRRASPASSTAPAAPTDAGSVDHTPTSTTRPPTRWSPIADLPTDLWGSGVHRGQRPAAGLRRRDRQRRRDHQPGLRVRPRRPTPGPRCRTPTTTLYRGGSACGFYKVGGSPGGTFVPPVNAVEVLPGFTDCDAAADVTWLSASPTTLTLAAGQVATVTVTLNAGVPEITQPGHLHREHHGAAPTRRTRCRRSGVTMTVNPPKTWGKIAGTVTSAADGTPIAGATVQIDTWAAQLHAEDRQERPLRAVARRPQQPAAADRRQGRLPAAGEEGEDHQGRDDDG